MRVRTRAIIRRFSGKRAVAPQAVAEVESGHLPSAYSRAEFEAFRAMLRTGTFGAEGLPEDYRAHAQWGMDILAIRDPQRLAGLLGAFNQGKAIDDLVEYWESHATH